MMPPMTGSAILSPVRRVLIADDDVEYARLVADTLAGAYDCRIVSVAEDAVKHFTEFDPAVVVAERWMGDADGLFRLLRGLRSARADLGILLTSTRPMSLAETMQCWDVDVDGCLQKPVAPDELAARVDQVVRRIDAARELHQATADIHPREV